MPKRWILTQESFNTLLMWLDPDLERAGLKYEEIRRSLIKIFTWRGISDAEELADETINRVAERVQELKVTYLGDPALYFYGVAKNLIHENYRLKKSQVPLEEEPSALLVDEQGDKPDSFERKYECMRKCLAQLSQEHREIILSYYSKEKQAKIDYRKELAEKLGIDANSLRVRVYRIRASLEECISACLERYKDEESS